MVLFNQTLGVKVTDCHVAQTFLSRMIGLLGKSNSDAITPIFFPDCPVIHTLGMRFPIDVIFLNRNYQVVGIKKNVGSGRWWVSCDKAHSVVEFKTGSWDETLIRVGDNLRITKHPTASGGVPSKGGKSPNIKE